MAEILTMLLLQALPKSECRELAYYLNHDQVRCHCKNVECQHTLVHIKTLEAWETVRYRFGKPIYVTNVFRCQKHNEAVGGVPGSKHTLGLAIDVSTYKLSPSDKKELTGYLEQAYDYVKEYPDKNFIHAQLNL